MFTGIVQKVGSVRSVTKTARDTRYEISTDLFADKGLDLGASVACNGVCLTVVDRSAEGFAVEVSTETLTKTTLGSWAVGSAVNLEPSLRMGDELGGHLVMGHVDGVAEIISMTPEGGSHRVTLRVPDHLAPYIAPKGAVALDGISLTVNEVDGATFGVNIIPYTWDHTNFSRLSPKMGMNVEIDTLARYVRRMMEFHDAA